MKTNPCCSFLVFSSLFLYSLLIFPLSFLFVISYLVPFSDTSPYTSLFIQPTTPSLSYKTSPTINIQRGFLIPPLSPSLIRSIPPLLAMALLSWSLLSADTEVFDPLTPNFLPGDDVHISMYSMVLVLWCMCMCACCSPVVQVCFSRSTTQYQSLEPLPPTPTPPQTPHQVSHYHHHPSTCCFYMKIRSADVLPFSFQNAAWHISCFYCMGVCVCRVCVRVFCVYV